MPLRCVSQTGEPVYAFNHDRFTWKRLAEDNRKDKHLFMSCCGRAAIVKTSHCGTQFFAHARRDGVNCPHESDAHLLAKDIIARAIVEAGWQAETEAVLSAHGLVADVLATKGKTRVAFEVQWSRQTWEETDKRHTAYAKAGIRVMWLFKQWSHPLSKEIPAFRIVPNDSNSFQVWVWRDGHQYEKVSAPSQAVELHQFIAGALSAQLKWTPAIGLTVPVIGRVKQTRCRRGHITLMLAELELDVARVLPTHPNPRVLLTTFAGRPEFLRSASALAQFTERGLYLDFGIRKVRSSRFTEEFARYIQPLCSTCGVDLDTYSKKEDPPTTATPFELSVTLSPQLVDDMPSLRRQLECWWFQDKLNYPN